MDDTEFCERNIPVFPPRTESATPAPLGKAMSTPTQSRLTSPRPFISEVGKLVECPHLVSEKVVNNLKRTTHSQSMKSLVKVILPKNKPPR